MLDVSTASVTVGAYRAQPMTANEIDAHPDCDRIWATIAAVRADVTELDEEERKEIEEEAFDEGKASVNKIGEDVVLVLVDEALDALEAKDPDCKAAINPLRKIREML